ncbi:MAG: YidC/Oxa1 family membrane protein insertase [Lachnospiraceae bacterium]|nr:YidC/Oxa1 family membrane protein insertase [Lachnospiraceae bacterium]
MDFLVLTKVGGLLSPFAYIIGWILNVIYKFLDWLNVGNVGLAIILMTVVINILMIPLTIKQQKFTLLNSVMQPEIMKLREKYARRADAQANMEMQQEMNKIYEKYGTSATGGCLQLVIQLPIIFALFSVIRSIPAYIEPIHDMYEPIADSIKNADTSGTICSELISSLKLAVSNFNIKDTNSIIDMLNTLRADQWDAVRTAFASNGPVIEAIDQNLPAITNAYTFLGLNIANLPLTDGWWPGVLVPVISAITQVINTKVSQSKSQQNMGGGMKMMMILMPVLSMVICFSLQIGVGLYWIARAVVLTIIILFINRWLEKRGIDKLVEESKAKADKKREKKIKKQGGRYGEFDTIANTSLKNVGEPPRRKTISEKAASGKNLKDRVSEKEQDQAFDAAAEAKDAAGSLGTTDASTDSKGKKSTGGRSISEIANMLKDRK